MKIRMLMTSALSLAILAGANAGEIRESRAAKVRYADLTVDSAAGVANLYGRVSAAARAVCQNWKPRNSRFSDLKPGKMQYEHCVDKAIVGAVAKLDRPAFSYADNQTAAHAAVKPIRVTW
jgi:UrcA family protein